MNFGQGLQKHLGDLHEAGRDMSWSCRSKWCYPDWRNMDQVCHLVCLGVAGVSAAAAGVKAGHDPGPAGIIHACRDGRNPDSSAVGRCSGPHAALQAPASLIVTTKCIRQ